MLSALSVYRFNKTYYTDKKHNNNTLLLFSANKKPTGTTTNPVGFCDGILNSRDNRPAYRRV